MWYITERHNAWQAGRWLGVPVTAAMPALLLAPQVGPTLLATVAYEYFTRAGHLTAAWPGSYYAPCLAPCAPFSPV